MARMPTPDEIYDPRQYLASIQQGDKNLQFVYVVRATFPDGSVGWYQRKGVPPSWVPDQCDAAVWSSKAGPASVKGFVQGYYRRRGGNIKTEHKPKIETVRFGVISLETK